jgi:hypothetical protein
MGRSVGGGEGEGEGEGRVALFTVRACNVYSMGPVLTLSLKGGVHKTRAATVVQLSVGKVPMQCDITLHAVFANTLRMGNSKRLACRCMFCMGMYAPCWRQQVVRVHTAKS